MALKIILITIRIVVIDNDKNNDDNDTSNNGYNGNHRDMNEIYNEL